MRIITPTDGLGVTTIRLDAPSGSMEAYIAEPEAQPHAPGVLLIHEVVGMSDYIKDVARRLGHAGFRVITPDLFHGVAGIDPADPTAIRRVLADIPVDRFLNDIAIARDGLQERIDTAARIATIGFCWGGTYSLIAGQQLPGFAAAVSYYGPIRLSVGASGHYDLIGQAEDMRVPVLLIYGEADHAIPVADVEELTSRLRDAGKRVETHVYPGALHGFHSDARPERYQDGAAKDAWQKTVAFLNGVLR